MKQVNELKEDYEAIPIVDDEKEALDMYYKSIGERIKRARESAGYTQAKLAELVGLTPSAIANYESGIRQIPVHMLLNFASNLGKPLQSFLGPVSEPQNLILQSLKTSLERFTESSYIEEIYELKDGKLCSIERPLPLIPLPHEFTKDYNVALRSYNEKTETYNYYICKWYKPHYKTAGILFFKKAVPVDVEPDPEDLVIAEHGDTGVWEMVKYKEVTPSPAWKEKQYIINVRAIVLSRVERLVK